LGYLLGRGLGFAVEGAELAERAEALIYGVYWDNDLDAVDLQVAQNAGVLGDGIYKVFFDPLEGRIRVVNVDPFCFFAHWAADDPSALRRVDVAYRVDSDDVVGSCGGGRIRTGSSRSSTSRISSRRISSGACRTWST
jgi:hypothetical protein